MAANVTVVSGNGAVGDVIDFTINEDATPNSAVRLNAEVGSLDATTGLVSGSEFLNQNKVQITHTTGTYTAIIDDVTDDIDSVSFSAGGILTALQVEKVMNPVGGSALLSDAYQYYINSCFSVPPAIVYLATTNPLVNYPSFGGSGNGTVWEYIKQLAVTTATEVAVVNGVITIRDQGSVAITPANLIDKGISRHINSQDISVYATGKILNTVAYTAPPGVATFYNYATNPSLETNVTTWTSGTGPFSSYTVGGNRVVEAGCVSGAADYTVAIDDKVFSTADPKKFNHVAKGVVIQTSAVSGIAQLDPLTISVSVKANNTNCVASIQVEYKNGGGTVLRTIGVIDVDGGYAVPLAYDVWTRLSVADSSLPPAGTTSIVTTIAVGSLYQNGSSLQSNTRTWRLDALMIGSNIPFFDGNTAGASWAGTTNNSASTMANTSNVSIYNAYKDNNTVYSVDKGETQVISIQTNNYPTALAQPLPVDTYPVIAGQYYVTASDNLPVKASEWVAYGGSVTVAIGATPGTIDLTLVGPPTGIPGVVGPYSLAVSDGVNNYAQLNIAGAGIFTSPTTLTLYTGADETKTQNTTPVDLSNPFIQNQNDFYNLFQYSVTDLSGPSITLTFTLNEGDANGLGLTPGAVFNYRYNKYRITNSQVVDNSVQISAVPFVKDSDFDAIWGNTGSIADTLFDASWAAKPYNSNDFAVRPLWR